MVSVLVIEDMARHRALIKSISKLPTAGARIEYYYWGEREGEVFAVDTLRDHILANQGKYDVISLDLTWPEADEYQFNELNAESLSSQRPNTEQLDAIQSTHPNGIKLLNAIHDTNRVPLLIWTRHSYPWWDEYVYLKGAEFVLHKDRADHDFLPRLLQAMPGLKQKLSQLDMRELKGTSRAMIKLRADINRAARTTKGNILITGPTGSGKSKIARVLGHGLKGSGKYVPRNFAAITKSLSVSFFSGNIKGYPNPTDPERMGCFREAENGVLFGDEIGLCPIELQPELLHAVDNNPTITPLGSETEIPVTARFISATDRDLEEMVAAGRFHRPLLERINQIHIHVPGLNEHRDDIPDLIAHFRDNAIEEHPTKCGVRFSEDAIDYLVDHDWSLGNCRSLENTIKRLVSLSPSDITRDLVKAVLCDLAATSGDSSGSQHRNEPSIEDLPPDGIDLKEAVEANARTFEEGIIKRALLRVNGNKAAAATLLRMSPDDLRYRMKKYGIE